MGNKRGGISYSSYRGRTSFWKLLLMVVLILIILGAGAFLFMQKYLVYNDDGTMRLDLPWQTTEEPTLPPADGADDTDLVIQKPEEPTLAQVAALLLQGTPAEWATQAAGLEAGGQNAFAVTVKDSEGQLHYTSATGKDFLATDAAAATQTLTALLEGEHHSIARIAALRDGLYAQANLDAAGLKNTGGYVFYDGSNQRWLDGSKSVVGDYLCAIAKECAELGFDEILLADFSYPTAGKLDKISYGTAVREQALASLLGRIRETLEPYGVRLSLELPKAVVESGKDAVAGLDTALLYPLVDAVYVSATEAETEALAKGLPEGVVLVSQMVAAPGGEISYLLSGA